MTTFTDFGQLSKAILNRKLPPKPVVYQYANVRVTMSKTPSDHRAYLNNSTEVANMCF